MRAGEAWASEAHGRQPAGAEDAPATAASAAPRRLVSRMLARAVATRGRRQLSWDASVQPLDCVFQAEEDGGREQPAAPAPGRAAGWREAEGMQLLQIHAAASEVCRRLLYVYVFAAGVNAHMIAHLLLSQWYRRAGWRSLNMDELILPLVHRMNGPPEWARCSAACRQLRGVGAHNRGLVAYWLGGYTAESCTEALKFTIQRNVGGLLRPLVDARADVNCTFEQCWFRTPLHRVVSRGHGELCRQLLALRADSTLCDSHGAAPLHLVASKGRLPLVSLLLCHDPGGVAAVDYSGRTPCHMAALKGHLAVVQRLVSSRASVAAQALDGRTPLDMAQRGQHVEILQYFESLRQREEEALPAARNLLGDIFRRRLRAVPSSAEASPSRP